MVTKIHTIDAFSIRIEFVTPFDFKIPEQSNTSELVSDEDSPFQSWNKMFLERSNQLFIQKHLGRLNRVIIDYQSQ